MGITEKAAYIKGLADGLNLDTTTNEGKIINNMLELIAEMAERISSLETENDDLYAYMEEMAQDIVAIEDDLYNDEFDDDYEDYSDLNEDDAEDDDFDEEDYYEIECPSCGEKICFTEDIDIENMVCPACNEKLGDIELCDGDCEACEENCSEE